MTKNQIRDLRNIIRQFDRELFFQNVASCCNGISPAQCHALLEIEKQSVTTVGELAQNLSLDKSTVSRTVEGLVNISLINREIPKENRRTSIIKLTESGKKVCKTIHYANDEYFEQVLSQFNEDEVSQFISHLGKFTNGMQRQRKTDASSCCK